MVLLLALAATVAWAEPGAAVSFGSLRIAPGVELSMIGPQHQPMTVMGREEPLQLQAGTYKILRWSIDRIDDRGEPWRLRSKSFPRGDTIQINAGQETVLAVGEPIHVRLRKRKDGRGHRLSCEVRGQMGEMLEIAKRGGRAIPPQLCIKNPDASYQQTMDFHFG